MPDKGDNDDVSVGEPSGETGEPVLNTGQADPTADADAGTGETDQSADTGQSNGTDQAEPAAGEAQATPARAAARPRGSRSTGTPRTPRSRRATAAAPEETPSTNGEVPPPRLRDLFRNEIVPNMMREFDYTNPMQVPRIIKIVLNIGLGEALTNNRAMESATGDLATISGQKPVITRARKSIAGFKLREGNPIGTSVTLRGSRMYYFLDRLVNMALPRIRDFRGIPRRGLDGRGNFSIGIREQIIFPEVDYNEIDRIRGLQVTIATTAKNDTEAIRLLELYGMPFVRES